MKLEGDGLVIHDVLLPRQDWEVRFAAMAERGDDRCMDETIATQWDDEEWIWVKGEY
jgi:hypothetical protein